MVLTGVVLALTVSPLWIYLAGFAGLGLTFAGLTDICPMGLLLGLLPWNRSSRCALGSQEGAGEKCVSSPQAPPRPVNQ
jgi:hypothetical protein